MTQYRGEKVLFAIRVMMGFCHIQQHQYTKGLYTYKQTRRKKRMRIFYTNQSVYHHQRYNILAHPKFKLKLFFKQKYFKQKIGGETLFSQESTKNDSKLRTKGHDFILETKAKKFEINAKTLQS